MDTYLKYSIPHHILDTKPSELRSISLGGFHRSVKGGLPPNSALLWNLKKTEVPNFTLPHLHQFPILC